MKRFSLETENSDLLTIEALTETSGEGKVIYNIDKEKSNVAWTGKKVVGQHHGNVHLADGKVAVQDDVILAAGVEIDMNSITDEDLTDPQWNQKLVGHLKSDDFFSVEKYPYIVFTATKFEPVEDSTGGEENYKVTGNLTIKGITHEIGFPARVEIDNGRLKANGKAVIDRTKWNIKYRSGSFFKGLGDNMIYNNFEIEFNLVAGTQNS